ELEEPASHRRARLEDLLASLLRDRRVAAPARRPDRALVLARGDEKTDRRAGADDGKSDPRRLLAQPPSLLRALVQGLLALAGRPDRHDASRLRRGLDRSDRASPDTGSRAEVAATMGSMRCEACDEPLTGDGVCRA